MNGCKNLDSLKACFENVNIEDTQHMSYHHYRHFHGIAIIAFFSSFTNPMQTGDYFLHPLKVSLNITHIGRLIFSPVLDMASSSTSVSLSLTYN